MNNYIMMAAQLFQNPMPKEWTIELQKTFSNPHAVFRTPDNGQRSTCIGCQLFQNPMPFSVLCN